MLIAGNHYLLTDAEIPKYILQHHIIRNFSRDIRNMKDYLPNILT